VPISWERKSGDDVIAIWDITETEDFLAKKCGKNAYQNGIDKNAHPLVRRQKLAIKCMLNELLKREVEFSYNKFGKPQLVNIPLEVSMTHSHEKVAVMLSPKSAGLDLQLIHPKIEKIVPRFLSKEELEGLSEKNKLEQAHILWCAKETITKIYGKKDLIFSKQILIAPFDYDKTGGSIKAKLKTNDTESDYLLRYEKLDDYLLVYLLND